MSKHGQPMSQTLAQMHLNELKMNDPKLNKIFDKLKKGDKVKLKTSSTMSKGSDFVEYIVKSKNVVNKGRVEKITLATVGNEKAVKKFLYRRDGKVTFAMGDMAASIDDIKEKYSVINHEIIEEIEVEELDEGMAYKFAAVDKKGLVIGFASKESDAKDMARRNKGRVVTLTKPLPDNKKSDMMINRPLPDEMDKFPTNTSATQGKRMEEDEIDEGKMKDRLMKAQDLMGPSKNREQGIEFVMKGLKVSKKEATKLVDAVLDMMMNNEVEIDEASARDDAMRAMGRGRRVDPADVDEPSASDADKKSAMKNVIMQMRQSLDSKGSKPIEFEDGKKQKVDPKILTLLTKAHDQIQKPRDKEQFVKMISKSYRDMLKVSKMVSKQLRMGEEIVLDEGFSPKEIKMAIGIASDPRYKGGNYTGAFKAIEKIKKGLASHPQVAAVLKRQNENLDEKYDLYHKTFSDAMQHAYDYAKKKLGITVDPKEIDSKVATGPKKPSEGKTNKYRLKGKGGNLQIQVYNKGGSKPFELNMYKEENEMTKSLKDTIVEMWTDSITEKVEYVEYKFKNEKDAKAAKAYFDGIQLMSFEVNDDNIRGGELMVDAGKKDMTKFHKEVMKKFRPKVMTQEGFDSDAQRKAAFASGYKEKGKKKDKEEGNEFSGNLNKARKDGKKTFKVGDKEYPVKPAKKESVERYLETKKNSLRDAVLQMWGEGVNEEEKDKKTLTKEKKDGNVKKMTDTGKEMTPVETSVKMPKIKETKNKV